MTRSIGKWKLPQPTDIKEENEWVQIPRIARTVPFGYKFNDKTQFITEVETLFNTEPKSQIQEMIYAYFFLLSLSSFQTLVLFVIK